MRLASRWLVVTGLLWMVAGVYFVAADEEAVVRFLGRADPAPKGPGAHWNWPWPLGEIDRLRVREVKRLTLGFAAPDRILGRQADPQEAQWLTGDRNVVLVRLVIQYAIRDPLSYLLRCQDPEAVLGTVARSALLETIAGIAVEDLLTTGKVEVQQRSQVATQKRADVLRCGVSLLSVSLEAVTPPSEVLEAFNDVARAREDRERLVREAESYRNEILPVARGEAQSRLAAAAGYRALEIDHAHGRAERFTAVAEASRRFPGEIRSRVYLETMERVLPRLQKTILEPGQSTVDVDFVRGPLGARPQP